MMKVKTQTVAIMVAATMALAIAPQGVSQSRAPFKEKVLEAVQDVDGLYGPDISQFEYDLQHVQARNSTNALARIANGDAEWRVAGLVRGYFTQFETCQIERRAGSGDYRKCLDVANGARTKALEAANIDPARVYPKVK